MELRDGIKVVYPGAGLATVQGRMTHEGLHGYYLVLSSGRGIFAPDESPAAARLRAPVDPLAGETLVQSLRSAAADSRDWPTRQAETEQALAAGTLQDQVAALGRLYASAVGRELHYPERMLRVIVEDVVLSELAHATGRSVEALSTELRTSYEPMVEA